MHCHLIFMLFVPICIALVQGDNPASSKKVHAGRIPAKIKEVNAKSSLVPGPGESTDVLIHPENLPQGLRDLKHEHKVLYLRARQKDYDFAKFGVPCQMMSMDEILAFLKLVEDTLEPSELERDLHQRLSPDEKGERLEKLFTHSKSICDYRSLLTCHENFRTCACAHPSMGPNREGVCGVNIGHVCEFAERTLLKYNILLTPQTSPIKCLLENAECVMDSTNDILGGGISPIRKICKCRKGFWGATCRRRSEEEPGNYLQNSPEQQRIGSGKGKKLESKESVAVTKEDKEAQDARDFWIHHGGATMGGHSLHPEEIKESLLAIMNDKGMYLPEEREKQAQELMKHLEQDVDKEEMVINEIHLRTLARLKLGEPCEPERQIILDNPPVAKDGQRFVDPNPEDIKSWQLGLLQDNKPFCNIHQNFRCDANTKVCTCKAGLAPNSESNGTECIIPQGFNCGPDFDPVVEFNPLMDRKRFSEAMPPDCKGKLECSDQPLFFEKKCWCKPGENCAGDFNPDSFKSQVKAIKSRFTLALGDSCDPKVHQQLLNYGSGATDPGYKGRLALLAEIIENPESRLCDIANYLNCSATSRTCQCWQQLTPSEKRNEYGINQCVATNLASCGKTFEYGKYMFHEGSQLWQVEKAFESYFRPECIPEAKCAGGDDLEWAGRCVCLDPSKTGEMCRDPKATLATAFKARQIPNNDAEEVALIRVFFDLNQQTSLLEQLMTLTLNKPCDPDTGLKLDRVVKFWKEVGSSDDTVKERRTLRHFVALTKWTRYLVNTVHGSSAALCNAKAGLRCHRTTQACGCPRGTRWVGDRCYVDVDEACDPKPGASWIPTCIQGTKCLSLRRNYGSYQCAPCPRGRGNCEGNDNDERIYDTWDVYEDHAVKGRSHGSKEEADETPDEEKVARGILVEDDEGRTYISAFGPREGEGRGFQSPNPNANSERHLESEDNSIIIPGTNKKDSKEEVENQRMDEGLTQLQKKTYLDEIERMLSEILHNRTLPFQKECHPVEERRFTDIFPALPLFNLNRLPASVQVVYNTLSRLYWQGINFCDRRQFLSCGIDARCGCCKTFGLIEENGECRLMEDKFCKIMSTEQEKEEEKFKKIPIFKCMTGTKCTKLDYGLPLCVRAEGPDDHVQRLSFLQRMMPISEEHDRGIKIEGQIKSGGQSWIKVNIWKVDGISLIILLWKTIVL